MALERWRKARIPANAFLKQSRPSAFPLLAAPLPRDSQQTTTSMKQHRVNTVHTYTLCRPPLPSPAYLHCSALCTLDPRACRRPHVAVPDREPMEKQSSLPIRPSVAHRSPTLPPQLSTSPSHAHGISQKQPLARSLGRLTQSVPRVRPSAAGVHGNQVLMPLAPLSDLLP